MGRYDVLLPQAGPRSLVEPNAQVNDAPGSKGAAAGGPSFDDILAGAVGGRVKLSAHARQRLQARGIELTPVDLDRISQLMDQLEAKGGRDNLLVGEKGAFVVSVTNRTVITAVPREELKQQVFTKIDSAALLD